MVLGGDVAVSIAPEHPGFFDYSDYELNTLRKIRLGVTAVVRATDRCPFSVMSEARTSVTSRRLPWTHASDHFRLAGSTCSLAVFLRRLAPSPGGRTARITRCSATRSHIPPGKYTVVAWLDEQTRDSRSVVVPAQGGIVEEDFQVQ